MGSWPSARAFGRAYVKSTAVDKGLRAGSLQGSAKSTAVDTLGLARAFARSTSRALQPGERRPAPRSNQAQARTPAALKLAPRSNRPLSNRPLSFAPAALKARAA